MVTVEMFKEALEKRRDNLTLHLETLLKDLDYKRWTGQVLQIGGTGAQVAVAEYISASEKIAEIKGQLEMLEEILHVVEQMKEPLVVMP